MSGYIGTQPVPQATQTRQTFTATASQTSFATGGYQAGYLDVFLNGVKLVDGTDYTATNGSDVVLTTGAASGDTLEVVAYTAFEVLNQNFTGGVTVDNDAATVLTVDRATSDGTIIDVQKDGTSVGSIGSAYGVISYINLDPRSGGTGVGATNTDSVIPVTGTGVSANGTKDLGISSARWRDLYLSGGVYLGGTGSANKLDDYEEGVYAPTITAVGGGTITLNTSYDKLSYTKVGRLVTVTGQLVVGSVSSPSGTLRMSLPFTSMAGLEDRADYSVPPIVAYFNGATAAGSGYYSGFLFISDSNTTGDFFVNQTSATWDNTVADWCATGTDFLFSFTYCANE